MDPPVVILSRAIQNDVYAKTIDPVEVTELIRLTLFILSPLFAWVMYIAEYEIL